MTIDKPNVILESERLILRTFVASDLKAMAAINSDAAVMKHFPGLQDMAATKASIGRVNQHFAKHGYALYAVELKSTHEFIGFVGLNQPVFDIPGFKPKGLPIVEIGWRLASEHWGKGYATEAALAVLDYAFKKLNLVEIISFTVVANTESRKVMEKIGLHHDEKDDFDHPLLDDDSPLLRHVLYRLTREEYQG